MEEKEYDLWKAELGSWIGQALDSFELKIRFCVKSSIGKKKGQDKGNSHYGPLAAGEMASPSIACEQYAHSCLLHHHLLYSGIS